MIKHLINYEGIGSVQKNLEYKLSVGDKMYVDSLIHDAPTNNRDKMIPRIGYVNEVTVLGDTVIVEVGKKNPVQRFHHVRYVIYINGTPKEHEGMYVQLYLNTPLVIGQHIDRMLFVRIGVEEMWNYYSGLFNRGHCEEYSKYIRSIDKNFCFEVKALKNAPPVQGIDYGTPCIMVLVDVVKDQFDFY